MALVEPLSREQLVGVHSPLQSPLVWDVGHIAAFEDLWLVHRHGGEPLLRAELASVYDAFETPRSVRGAAPLLEPAEALHYLGAVRERALVVADRVGLGDGVLGELVARHELQHQETMLQTLALARIPSAELPGSAAALGAVTAHADLEFVEIDAGPCMIGAPPDGFAYDNERPCHEVELEAFRIGRAPVSNASFRAFVEEDGTERPAGWTADGREWRLRGLEPLDPAKPVMHVSWFAADAFARSRGARLPTEREWERAAAEPGLLEGVGEVWEWTASEFRGYPGFVAHPYRAYSEVFFDSGHMVLRGGSGASAARVVGPTFRNWDLPQRRQIFAGLRIATDG